MKKRILSLILVLCLITGVFSLAIPVDAASAIFSSHEVYYGSYGVIYFTLAPKDFTADLDYINSQAIYSNGDADMFLPLEILNNDNIQSINIVLTHDWETKYFITNKNANVNIDLNGHTWKVTGSAGLRTEKKNITISGGTMIFTDTTWGPITTYGGNISVQNVIFKNINTSGYGVIYVDDKGGKAGSVNLSNVTFENCYSDSYGGCIYINSDNSKSTINNCRFINCTATNSGGAVYVDGNNCDVSFNSCRFTGCKSENNGGAFSIAGNYCDISFYSCSAFNCHADDCGGFMYVWGRYDKINGFGDKDSSKYEDRSIVVNCHALGHGGAVYFSDDTASGHYGDIRNFIFASNAAGATSRTNIVNEKKGGAVCVYSESVKVYYCDFYDNYAGDCGGAIYLQDNYDDVEYCTFEDDQTAGDGSEIYIDDADTWVWHNILYTSESSSRAIYNNRGGSLSDNTFNPSSSFGGGNGSASNPYKISTAEHLRLLARNVNKGNNYGGKHFVLTADIKNVCSPIGNNYYASHYFGGIFDGQGHSVTLAMYKNGCAASLFAHLAGAEVRNVCVKGYTGGTMAAGIAGHAHCSIISGCTNEATVESTSDWFAGGIVAYSVNYTYISRCKNTGKVSGNNRVGGIAGYVYNGAVVESYNVGAVSATTYDTGGVVGYTEGTLFVTNCTNDAPVSSRMSAAGIVGNSYGETTVINCYNTKRGVTSAYAYSGGILGWCDNTVTKTVWGTKQCMTKRIYNCVNYADIKCQNTGAGGIVGYAASNVPSGTSGNPLEIHNCASYCSTPEIYVSGQITGTECHGTFTKCYISQKHQHWWESDQTALSDKQFGQYLVGKLNAEVKSKNSGAVSDNSDWYTEPRAGDWAEWTVSAGSGMAVPLSSESFLHTEARQEMGGKGTKSEPYTILSNTQLKTLRSDIEAGKDYSGCYFELKGHIKYTGMPIGTEAHPFKGIFNGAGYTVVLDINLPDSDYCALFGYAKDCTVENLTVNGIVKCNNYAAGIIAHADGNVTVDNCCSDLVEIIAKNIGAAGICAVSEGNTVIKNCHNSSSVQSQSKEKYNPIDIDDDIALDIDAPVLRSPYGRSDPEREKRLQEQAEKKRREVLQKLNEERMQNTYNQCAGGVIARVTKGDVAVLNTVNTGSISAFSRVGGIIGKSDGSVLRIYNCGNYGVVSAGSDMAALGGIIGQAERVDMLVCLNAATIPEPKSFPEGMNYGAVIGLVNGIDNLGTCYYLIKTTGYKIPGYNAGSEKIDTGKFTAMSIKKASLKPAKFNGTDYKEVEQYEFTEWIKSAEKDETNGLPVPGNFEQIDIAVKETGKAGTIAGSATYSSAAKSIDFSSSFFASVFASSDILIIGILLAISAVAVTVMIVYKKKRKR